MTWETLVVVGCVWLYDLAGRWELSRRIARLEALIRADRTERGLP